jgi:hypothetical protein
MEKEVRIQFETAKLAKEKGYRISNQYVFDESTGELLPRDPAYPGWHDYAIVDGVCASPSQTILQKWMRENHKIFVWVENYSETDYGFKILHKNKKHTMGSYDKYEEALEQALQQGLKLI